MGRPTENETQFSMLSGLNTEQLLLLERACDQYEVDFRSQRAADVETYLAQLPTEMHTRVRVELQTLRECLLRDCLTQEADLLARATCADGTPLANTPQATSSAANAGKNVHATVVQPLRAGRFELHELLGTGGAGAVWKALDRQLNRWVAFKIPLTNTSIDADKFLEEARTAARLRHPNIVGVLDVGQDEQGCFIVQELIEGLTLSDKLRQSRYDARAAAELVSTIAAAVAYAHQTGIVHRDLKPQNILIDAHDRPMILDFGLACEWFVSLPQDHQGKILGTPAYMAPEQAAGQSQRAEPRTDVYALGVILFQMVTGELPFRGDVPSVLHQVQHVDPPLALDLNPQVPVELSTLCESCLEKSITRRLASAAFLHDELQRYLRFQPIHSRPTHWRSRVAKWFYRSPLVATLCGLAGVMVGLLLIGAIATTIIISRDWEREHILRMVAERERLSAVEARDKQREALEQAVQAGVAAQESRSRAEAEAILSQASLQYLESMIQSSDPVSWVLQTSLGPVTEAPQLADWLDAAAQRTRVELVGQPRVQARMLDTIANGCRSLGRYAEARQLLDQADLIRNAAGATGQVSLPVELVRHKFYRALLCQDTADLPQARELFGAALNECSNLKPATPLLEADIHFHLGWNHSLDRKFDLALPCFQRALEIRRAECHADSGLIKAAELAIKYCEDSEDGQLSVRQLQAVLAGNDRYSRLVNDYLKMLAWRQLGRWSEAIDAYQSILDQLTLALPAKHPLIVLAHGEYAEVCWRGGDFRRALPAIEKAIAWAEELAPEHVKLRQAREFFGSELLRAQRFEEAGEQFQRLIDRDTKLGDRFSSTAYEGMVWVHLMTGRTDEAIELAEQLIAHTSSEPAYRRAWFHYVLARAASKGDEKELEQKNNEQAYELAASVVELPQNGLWLERLSNIFVRENQLDRSLDLLEKSIACERNTKPARHPHLAERLMTYARVLKNAQSMQESEKAFREAQAIYKLSLPEDDVRLQATLP